MKRKSKYVLYVFFSSLWLFALSLTLELGARGRAWWIETHNPYIVSVREKSPFPENNQIPPLSEVPDPITPPGIAWFDAPAASNKTPSAWEIPVQNEGEDAREARRRLFPALNEADRVYFAAIHNDLILERASNGAIIRRYGNWTREDPGNIEHWMTAGRQDEVTHYAEVHIVVPGFDLPMKTFHLREVGSETTLSFLNLEELFLKNSACGLAPDSAWEYPFFQYKKHLADSYTGLGTHHVSTNNFGYRGPDIQLPKPEGMFRILCVGASTTEEGEEGATYPQLLERALQEDFPGKRIEVVNCGISGMTTARHLLKLAQYLDFQPDLMVIYAGVNDICQDLQVYWQSKRCPASNLAYRSFLLRHYANRLFFPSKAAILHDLKALPLDNIAALHRAATARGIHVAVCGVVCPDIDNLPAAEREYFDYQMRGFSTSGYMPADVYAYILKVFLSELKQFCGREKLLYIPVEDHISGGLSYFTDICHLWPGGIEKKAQVISHYLSAYIAPALDRLQTSPIQ